jgi:two-component system sensor histidine kinase KdpD
MSEKGRRFPTERNANMKQEQLGHNDTFFWTFLDQTSGMIEHARLQREMLQIELLKRTDSLRSALLSSVSHDLRTPLASIKASASSLLQEDVEWDDETKRSFAITIERESDRLNRLVGNLLDMSRIEGGALKPEKEWYPIDEVIHDVVDRMRGILQGREIQTHLSDDLPPVEIDYLQMDQVITNLLENAARYTPIGSPIEVSAEVIDGEVKISIADRGPGIPADDLERIFDKFYRVSGTPRKGNQSSTMGTGLGLAVCRGLVEAHGGHIWAANRPDGGAIFQFTLPVSPFHIQQGRQATPLS